MGQTAVPIRPENKSRYPANWKSEIRPRILKRATREGEDVPRCEECGVVDRDIGYRDSADGGKFCSTLGMPDVGEDWYGEKVFQIILTIAHLSDEIEDCSDENLKALCQRCHNRLDAPKRAAGIKARRRAQCAGGDLFQGEANDME